MSKQEKPENIKFMFEITFVWSGSGGEDHPRNDFSIGNFNRGLLFCGKADAKTSLFVSLINSKHQK
jgi:hypothetical protein